MGESKIFCARSIGEPEGRTSSAIVLPICATGVDTTPICDEAMDNEACILLMIPLFFCWCARNEYVLLVNNWLFR
jgi:hypothetical protein